MVKQLEIERPFAAFDIDGTLIRWQLYHAIADYLVKLGFIAPVKFQAIKDARMVWKRRENSESYRQYEQQLVKLYSEIMQEITYDQFQQTAESVFLEYKDQVYIYTRALLKHLKQDGYLLFAISGSHKEIIEKMAKYYDFDDFSSREDEHKDNHFTGKSTTPIFNKDEVLKELVKKHRANFKGSIVVGDSISDAKMLAMAERPIAFNPERKLFDHAKQKDWKIVLERKNMYYELEYKNGKYQLV
jgi:HAD superfamily phosphoserine phosphatase-like hydrolase